MGPGPSESADAASGAARGSRLPQRLLGRALTLALAVHAGLTRLAGRMVPRRPAPADSGWVVLLTGAFQSDNWAEAHLRPLLLSPRIAALHVVSLAHVPALDRLHWHRPPAALVRVAGPTLARALSLLGLAWRLRPHLVGGFHLLPNGLVAATVARLSGARSLYFCVGGPTEILDGGIRAENRLFKRLGQPHRAIEARLLAAALEMDVVVTMGRSASQFFRRHGARTVATIAGGIDARRYQPAAGSGRPAPRFDLVFVGRLTPIKRVDRFIDLVAALERLRPAVQALVIGDGPLRTALEARADALGVANRIHFAGFQRDVVPWLRQSRVFVLTSETEGVSLALLEAMLCGLPALVPAVGDLADVVEDGTSGCLVVDHDPDRYAQCALQLLAGADASGQQARAARQAALAYDLPRAAARWTALLDGDART